MGIHARDVNVVGAQHRIILAIKPGVQRGRAFLQIHRKDNSFVLFLYSSGQSLKLIGAFFADAHVVVAANEKTRVSDRQRRAGPIGQGSADRPVGFLGPATKLNVVFACLSHVDQPIAALLRAFKNLVLLIDKHIEPFGAG